MIVFPEGAQVFPRLDVDRALPAELVGGPFTIAVDDLAAETGLVVVVGMVERAGEGEKPFNTVYVSNGTGIATYRKLHLYDAFGFRESDFIRASDDMVPVTFEVKEVRFGVMTCYDLRFPESARELGVSGADVILVPAAWAPGPRKEDHWNVLVRARAIENTCFVVAPNQTLPNGTGFSLVVDPMGVVVAELDDRPQQRVVDLDVCRLENVRSANPSLSNRRFDVVRRARVGNAPMPSGRTADR